MRRAWLIRPPKGALRDDYAIETGIVTGEFAVREDLSDHIEYEQILQEVEIANPKAKPGRIESLARQLNVLLNDITPGDLVIHPHGERKHLAVGIFRPEVVIDSDGRPGREVEWLRTSICKTHIHADLHYSLSSGLQICEISRNNAVSRIEALVAEGKDPGPKFSNHHNNSLEALSSADLEVLLWQRASHQIGAVFAGHDMALLVGALLEIDGYKVAISPPGPDGGCDLTAGRGTLGFDGPTIAGQVKSGDIVVTDQVFQSLQGVVHSKGADRGLLVSWGGITRVVAAELERMPFTFAYWGREEISRRLVENYDALPLWVRDRLRLRTVPVLEQIAAVDPSKRDMSSQ